MFPRIKCRLRNQNEVWQPDGCCHPWMPLQLLQRTLDLRNSWKLQLSMRGFEMTITSGFFLRENSGNILAAHRQPATNGKLRVDATFVARITITRAPLCTSWQQDPVQRTPMIFLLASEQKWKMSELRGYLILTATHKFVIRLFDWWSIKLFGNVQSHSLMSWEIVPFYVSTAQWSGKKCNQH